MSNEPTRVAEPLTPARETEIRGLGDDEHRTVLTMDNALDDVLAELDRVRGEMGGWDDEARERWIQKQLDETGIRAMEFRNGAEMELEPARDLVAHWVGAARTMLGDAPNYSETRVSMQVKVAESPETFAFVLQRVAPGALTPHEARQKAEAERDALITELASAQAQWELHSSEATVRTAERDQARAELAQLKRDRAPRVCECGHSVLAHCAPEPHSCFGNLQTCPCPAYQQKTDGSAPPAATENYPGELAMFRGLLGVVRTIAQHSDIDELRRVIAEHQADEQAAYAESEAGR